MRGFSQLSNISYKIRILTVLMLIFLRINPGFSQNGDLPFNSQAYHLIDRVDIRGLADTTVHTDIKPYPIDYVGKILGKAYSGRMTAKEQQWTDRQRFLWDDQYAVENRKKGIFGWFYTNERDLYHFASKDFSIFVNPVVGLSAGGDLSQASDTSARKFLFNSRNTKGAQVRGTLLKKIGFFTELTDNQVRYPYFVKKSFDEYGVLFGEGFMKTLGENGYDYFNARGYLTYSPFKFMRIKFGKDKAFWGNGYQSLFLSDYATEHFLLNINTRIWKLEYTNHFAQMIDFIRGKPDDFGTQPKKYAAFHQISYKPSDKLSFSIFESVVYSPVLPGGVRGFELEYLNPIIFYRSVEQSLGSPDNSMLGGSWKANFAHHFQFYGQLLIDDFNWGKRDEGKGYFGNKYGYQLGGKYIDVAGISGLDLQAEYNRVRPFTYQHFNPSANYSHYGQPLAHSMGANLWDANLIVRYQPWPQWYGQAIVTVARRGADLNGVNNGGNIFLSYISRPGDFNNFTTQGELVKLLNLYGKIGYQILRLNAYAEVEARFRRENEFSSMSVLGSLRFNLPDHPIKF
ncbi:MAG: hypothetical protein H6581_01270 [Bacteroidia bacterium]|nr:hypothetical protein [Bacteroidia bacterium]